jgi:hypothetical protein
MIPTITSLPSPSPSSTDPDDFDDRADELLGALPLMVDEQNDTIDAMNTTAAQVDADAVSAAASAATAILAPGTRATIAGSLTIPGAVPNTISFTLDQTGKLFGLGQTIVFALTSDPADTQMIGRIVTFVSATGIGTAKIYIARGVGAHSGWEVNLSPDISDLAAVIDSMIAKACAFAVAF